MKRILSFCLVILLATTGAFAKYRSLSGEISVKGSLNETFEKWPSGTKVTIQRLVDMSDAGTYQRGLHYILNVDGQQYLMPAEKIHIIDLAKPGSDAEFWQQAFLKNHLYEYWDDVNYSTQLLREVDAECYDYLENLRGILYEDAYATTLAQGLLAKLCSDQIRTRQNGNLQIHLIQSPEPLAFTLPNGGFILSTGLFCALDSEEELAAIIASEAAHFLFDHQIKNIRRAEIRAKRASFWADVFNSVSQSLTYDYYATGDDRYLGTSLIADMGTIISLVCLPVINRFGLNYSEKQDAEADRLARELLTYKRYRPEALVSALQKISDYYARCGQDEGILRYQSLENLNKRIETLAGKNKPAPLPGTIRYGKQTYDIVNFNAALNYSSGMYQEAIRLLEKNIANNRADSETYLIRTQAEMAIYNNEEANERCLAWLDKAEQLSAHRPNLNIDKQRALLFIRMDRIAQATEALNSYIDKLTQYQQQQPAAEEERMWIEKEINWSLLTLEKISR